MCLSPGKFEQLKEKFAITAARSFIAAVFC
jgi:hypothetical protein